MSNYESERGRWKLPSSEYAAFRQAIQKVDMERKEKAFALTQECWKSLSRKEQTDKSEYRNAIRTWVARKDGHQPFRDGTGNMMQSVPRDEALELASHMMEQNGQDGWKNGQTVPREKPSRVQKAEVDWPTNRSTSFSMGEATVSFDPANKTVSWGVDENNHAVETAHGTPLGRAFWGHLSQVRWAHGTGGYSRYSSEYDEDEYGGRTGSRINSAHGYAGIDAMNSEGVFGSVEPFQNPKGEWIGSELVKTRGGYVLKPVKGTMRPGRWGGAGEFVPTPKASKSASGQAQGRVHRGVPSGGQFATRGRGESDVRL